MITPLIPIPISSQAVVKYDHKSKLLSMKSSRIRAEQTVNEETAMMWAKVEKDMIFFQTL